MSSKKGGITKNPTFFRGKSDLGTWENGGAAWRSKIENRRGGKIEKVTDFPGSKKFLWVDFRSNLGSENELFQDGK